MTAGSIIQSRLDKVKGVEPINPNNYNCLVGRQVVAVIHKSDVSVDSDSGKANLQGERRGLLAFTVLGIEPAGSIAESGSSDSFPVLRVRIDPPVGISNLEAFECDSNPTSPGPGRGPGLASGHFDLDTSSFISPVNSGSTGKHVHQYDDKFDVPGADFFNLLQDGLSNINDEISPGTKFKVIIANADLSTGGRLVINNTYDPDRPDSWVSVQEYANIPLADLPVFTHKAASAKNNPAHPVGYLL